MEGPLSPLDEVSVQLLREKQLDIRDIASVSERDVVARRLSPVSSVGTRAATRTVRAPVAIRGSRSLPLAIHAVVVPAVSSIVIVSEAVAVAARW